jgi:catechol 2,3-dioxygenase-like lactoylglutathione lyase family enzyme
MRFPMGLVISAVVHAGGATWAAEERAEESAAFHHVHVNATDPARSIKLYERYFSGVPVKFAGVSEALLVDCSFILYSKVDEPAPTELTSARWHIGWGCVDGPSDHARREKAELEFEYLWATQVTTGGVTINIFGKPGPEKPFWWSYDPIDEFAPTRGRVIDHIAFSYRDIKPVFERMQAAGLEIVEPIAERSEYGLRSFFVQGPDGVLIEIVEAKPLPEGVWEE